MLDQNSPKKRGDQARELIRHLEEWADQGGVNPVVAEHLIAQLEPIASSDRPGPGDDDD